MPRRASVHGSAPIITKTAVHGDLLDAAVAAVAEAHGLHGRRAVHRRDLGLGHDLDARRALDAIDEVMRHRRLQRLAPNDDAHAAGPRGEVRRRLSGRVAAADDDHVLVAATLGVGGHHGVVDAGAAEAVDALGLQLPPAGPGRHDDGTGENMLAVVEVDPHQALGPVGDLDRAMEARQHRVEAARLERRLARQLGARDAVGKPR